MDKEFWNRLIELVLQQIDAQPNGCWNYTGLRVDGWRLEVQGVQDGVPVTIDLARAMYRACNPGLVEGQQLRRTCENPLCVAPHHRDAVPSRRMISWGARPHPAHGVEREKFMKFVAKRDSGCWSWVRTNEGAASQGLFWLERRLIGAQRAAYVLFRGEIPDGKAVSTSCNKPECVNPEHLRAGTRAELEQESMARARVRLVVKLIRRQVASMRTEFFAERDLAKIASERKAAVSTVEALVSGRTWSMDSPASSEISEPPADLSGKVKREK